MFPAIFDGNGLTSDLDVQERLMEEELKDRQRQFALSRSKLISRKGQWSPPSAGKNETGVFIQVGEKLIKVSEELDERLDMLERSKHRPGSGLFSC